MLFFRKCNISFTTTTTSRLMAFFQDNLGKPAPER